MNLKHSLILITSVLVMFGCLSSEGEITSTDFPKVLGDKLDTIEVTYIAWACACANWLPTKYLEDPNYEPTENPDDCIFIEAENKALILPEEYEVGGNTNRIKLIGKFYKDKGISKDYIQPTSQRPEYASVFKYSTIEVIKPYTIWDFKNKDENGLATQRTIGVDDKVFYE